MVSSSVSSNPHDAPIGVLDSSAAPAAPRVFSGVLLFFGSCMLLMLNGQQFTNTLVFLMFVVTSAMLWLRFRMRNSASDPAAGRFALLIHLVLLFAFAATLPAAYTNQQKFNKKVNSIHTRFQTQRR